MGLDMYLEKKTYVKQWDHQSPEQKYLVAVSKGGTPVESIKSKRISYIIEQVAYWRKANQIHAWFVSNVQHDNNDCSDHYVSHEQLKELVSICEQVVAASELITGDIVNGYSYSNGNETPNIEKGKIIKDASLAKELLPTQSGFFFGGTEYDEYYLADIINTIDQLKPLLEEDGGDYYYNASW